MSDSSCQTKIKCLACGKEFECGYAADMHVVNGECYEIDIENIEYTIFKHEVLNKIVEKYDSSHTRENGDDK